MGNRPDRAQRLLPSFSNLVAGWVVGLHLLLLPALYFGIGYVVRTSHEDLFVQHARTFSRVIADEFEVGAALENSSRITDLLDLAITHGEGNFAELATPGRSFRSEAGAPGIRAPSQPDLGFNHGGDNTYFIILPIVHAGTNAELRLGFDERPTNERIQLAMNRLLWVLTAYSCVAICIALVLSYRLSRPILALRQASRVIASGDYAHVLSVRSGIRELHGLGTDLDDMRRELVGVNAELQTKIRERDAAELSREELQRQLRHRQRLETVGTLAGGIAHEFNNLLQPIILFTDSALQDLDPSSVPHRDLERVLTSARRAKDVVQKILMFSRDLGDVQLQPTDLKGVIREALHLFETLAPSSVEIRTELPEQVAPVKADPTLAMHMVLNLCTNAFQAMRDSRGTLTVGLADRPNPMGEPGVELWVTDTGHGMDAATAERIFEPFFTTRSVGEGTGLGLSMVHGIVQSFGARIEVQSTAGKGSTFRIFFPAITPEARAISEEPCKKYS